MKIIVKNALLLFVNSGVPWEIKTSHHTLRASRGQRDREVIPMGRWLFQSARELVKFYEAHLGAIRQDLLTFLPELCIYIEALTGFIHIYHTVQMASTPHYTHKVAWLQCGSEGRNGRHSMHSKDRGLGEEPLIPQVQLSLVNQQLHPLNDVLQHFTPHNRLLQTYSSPLPSAMCPEPPERECTSMAVACFWFYLEANIRAAIEVHAREDTNQGNDPQNKSQFFPPRDT